MKPAAVLLTVFVVWAWLAPSASSQSSEDVFTGIIQEMNAEQGKLTVKNELGREVVLELENPDLLRGLVPGDQVSIEMEKPGTAKKITKLSVPELKTPHPPDR